MHPLVNLATHAARTTSKSILLSLDRLDSIHITQKQRNDFVTEVDKIVEQEIIHKIHQKYPNHSILGEETGKQMTDEFCWIIDPIDGTTNFIHGVPHFAVSIAVAQNNKLIAAVIYDPIRGELFKAAKGEGARLNERRIRVSQHPKLENALLGTGFPFKQHQNLSSYLSVFELLFRSVGDIRRAGSACLDLAYVAAGRLEGFFEWGLSPWDMAAGVLLIREAGGLITDWHGEDNYFKQGHIVTGNTKMVKSMLLKIRQSDFNLK